MESESVISVRGEARLEVEPEIALLGVTVMAQDKDRRRAVELLAGRTRAVADLIKGYGEAVEKLESGPARVHPAFKDGKGRERVAGYVARAGFSVAGRACAEAGQRGDGRGDRAGVAAPAG
jgi:uncharacterized protein YggE